MQKEIKELMGKKIMQIRKMRGMNQDDLATGIGLTRTSVVNIEKGKQALSAMNVIKICEALNVNPADIFPESKNSITILVDAEIHKLKTERDEWKKKYFDLTGLLSKLKEHI